MVSLDVLDITVHGEPTRKGHSQVISQRAVLASLVGQVVDQLAVLAIFAGQDVLQLEYGGIDGDASVALENFGDRTEDLVTNDHVLALPFENEPAATSKLFRASRKLTVFGALRGLKLEFGGFGSHGGIVLVEVWLLRQPRDRWGFRVWSLVQKTEGIREKLRNKW